MIHAVLITGGNKQLRDSRISELCHEYEIKSIHIRTLSALNASIGVEQTRTFIRELSIKSGKNTFTAGIIPDAHLLTIAAQNALLKTIEEPPANTIMLLETLSEDALLPTIRSRCQHIILPGHTTLTPQDCLPLYAWWETLLGSPLGKRLALLDSILEKKTSEEIVSWLSIQLTAMHIYIINQQTMSLSEFPYLTRNAHHLMSLIDHAIAQIYQNIHTKLTLDWIVLSIE